MSYQNLIQGQFDNKPSQNLNVNSITTGTLNVQDLKTIDYDQTYLEFTFDLTAIIPTPPVVPTNIVVVNAGDPDYVGSVDVLTGDITFTQDGIYSFEYHTNNTVNFPASFLYFKFYIINGVNNWTSITPTISETAGTFNSSFTTILNVVASDGPYSLSCRLVSGSGPRVLLGRLTITRLK
jgi:hypothetical protein